MATFYLSNWYIEELEEFLPQVNILSTLVQNEIHPYYQENDAIPYIQGLGIVVLILNYSASSISRTEA